MVFAFAGDSTITKYIINTKIKKVALDISKSRLNYFLKILIILV